MPHVGILEPVEGAGGGLKGGVHAVRQGRGRGPHLPRAPAGIMSISLLI